MNRLPYILLRSPWLLIGIAIIWLGLTAIAPAEDPSTPADGNQSAGGLLENGDMEGEETPLNWKQGAAIPGVRYTWDRAEGHASKGSLCLHKTASRYFPVAQWYQRLPKLGPTSRLKISAWVKAEKATKGIVDVLFADKNGKGTHHWVAYVGAKNAADPPVSHDWTEYSGIAEIPDGTTRITIALQIYGPGKLWFDDVHAEALFDRTPKPAPPADAADIPSQDLKINGDDRMRYFLVGPRKDVKPPGPGFKLVVILPGGDGSENFNPFVRRISKNALGDEYVVAQPVAFKWRPTQQIVWPTRANSVEGQEFSTEDFVEAIVRDVKSRHQLNERHVFTLSWSSGGPAAYAISLAENSPVTGSYVAMSVFNPHDLPPLTNAKGHAYLIEHSPDDRVCPFRMAKEAEELLKEHGAVVRFSTYQGGHGWRGDMFGRIRNGVQWLEGATVVNE